MLLGVSRKSTIGLITGQTKPAERVAGSIAAGLMGVANGAAILRVHDVAPHVQALRVWRADRGKSTMSGRRSPARSSAAEFSSQGLRLHAFHGNFAHERKHGQMFEIDLELIVDLAEAAAGDDLKATVDYGKVAAITRQTFCGEPRKLVEAAALDVAQALLEAFPASSGCACGSARSRRQSPSSSRRSGSRSRCA